MTRNSLVIKWNHPDLPSIEKLRCNSHEAAKSILRKLVKGNIETATYFDLDGKAHPIYIPHTKSKTITL